MTALPLASSGAKDGDNVARRCMISNNQQSVQSDEPCSYGQLHFFGYYADKSFIKLIDSFA